MRRMLSTFGGLALGLVLSQFPEYAQQYTQRLGGAVDELRIIAEDFDRSASAAGLSRQEALGRYAGSADTFLEDRGLSMAATLARYEQLSAMLARIEGAGAWERFTLLPDFLDTDIGARALENFQPAVPVTMEGFAYAGGGFVAGYLLLSAIVNFLLLPFRPRRRRDAPAPRMADHPAVPAPPAPDRRPAPPPAARRNAPAVNGPAPDSVRAAGHELTVRRRAPAKRI